MNITINNILCFFILSAYDKCYAGENRLTPAYFFGTTINLDFGKFPIGEHPTSFLVDAKDPDLKDKISKKSENAVPVIVGADRRDIPLNLDSYFNQLRTKTFGRNLIIGDTIPTTMNLAHDFGGIPGLLVIANEQTKGRGNNNTSWESPRGDLMITVNIKLRNKSRSSLLGAHCALSMMKAVHNMPNGDYSQLPIKFSWPISLHWSTYDKKIGGVLVEQIKEDSIGDNWFASGCGLRVNSKILFSVSKIIDEHNSRFPDKKLQQLNLEQLIANTMNHLEEYLDLLEDNPKLFNDMVIENWMNSEQLVNINVNAKVRGLTENGFMIFDDDNGLRGFLKPDSSRFKSRMIVV